MYGFGDEEHPHDSTVDLLETYTEEFIANVVARTMRRSLRIEGNSQLLLADLLKVLEKDEVNFLRMAYILPTYESTQRDVKGIEDVNHVKYLEDDEVKKTIGWNSLNR